jgi:hypothetical protein
MSEAHDPPDLGTPPDPPGLLRRIHLYRTQWIGLPILFALPFLAIVGVFGERRDVIERTHDSLWIAVDHPTRLRAGQRSDILVRVVNRGTDPVGMVDIVWDPQFLAAFAAVERIPAHDPAPPEEFDLDPGEERLQRIELEGDALWRRRGFLEIRGEGREPVRIELGVFVLP